MSALVSIIIPVYNLEDYIENCLNKLINQTYRELEIICVDDGSFDSSSSVIKSLIEKDNRIKYIRQKNSGVSAARNKGLEAATGKYVMFVDGDDYLHRRAVEVFVSAIENSDFDIVCAPEKATSSTDEPDCDVSDFSIVKSDSKGLFSYQYGSVLGKSVWSKIIKADLAKSVKFNSEFINGEDANYMVRLLVSGAESAVINKPLYYYFTRENSCVTSRFNKKKFSITLSFDDLCDFLKDKNDGYLITYCLQYLFQTICYNRTMAIGTEAEAYVLKESKRIGNKWIKTFIKCKDIDIKIRAAFALFYYSRHIYELARMIQDPTMKDFYKNRKANRKD